MELNRKEFTQGVDNWNDWYFTTFKSPYFFEPKDFNNLKYLLRKLKASDTTLQDYLDNIESPWHLANASLPLYNSHFNQLIKPKASHPHTWSKKYELTLEPQEAIQYHRHLMSLGYKSRYSPGGGTAWIKE